MYFVYILRSIPFPSRIYVGCTSDLKKRLANHNCGTTRFTTAYKPWKIETYTYFARKEVAYRYEKYLKSGSGMAFVWKRLVDKSANAR